MKLAGRLFEKVIIGVEQKKVALLVSLCNVIVLLLLTYFVNNQPLFTGEDLDHHAWMEWVKSKIGLSEEVNHDDVLFVNVAYDKQLTELTDKFGMPIGNIDITDHSKLLELLKVLHSTEKYKYIFLDVRFEKGYEAPEVDSALFAEIRGMKNIVIANHSDMEIADSGLFEKAAISDYMATITATNFVRYQYSYSGEPTMPLYAYRELTEKTINNHILWYTCNDRLCYNSLFIEFPIEDFEEFDNQNNKRYYNLGSDLLDNYSEEDIATLTDGKYIVVGDMVEDIHDTYSGMKPGSVIMFYAFQALMKDKHFVSLGLWILMAIVFFLISLSQFSHRSLIELIPYVHKSKSKILHFALSFVEYTFILATVAMLLSIMWGVSISILVPSTYFAIQKTIINYKRTKI